ncbi:MAG: hypothetical protein IPH27_11705 [Actinomycetales bacterium]|nr:hypothetical protein [Candidatus Phosphoribacter baldrii]
MDASPELTIACRCADLAGLVRDRRPGTGRVAVVSPTARAHLSRVANLRESGVEVVGPGDPGRRPGRAAFWQLGVHSVVLADAASDVLVAALAAASHGSPSGRIRGR